MQHIEPNTRLIEFMADNLFCDVHTLKQTLWRGVQVMTAQKFLQESIKVHGSRVVPAIASFYKDALGMYPEVSVSDDGSRLRFFMPTIDGLEGIELVVYEDYARSFLLSTVFGALQVTPKKVYSYI
jgi:hypothetical protein